jgi:PHD/YefM family antitoxin component YafN of YafNO toxin-antitoxin module
VSVIRSMVKTAVAAKVIQIAQRELSKPENQRKIKEGLDKLRQRRRPS